MYKLKTFLQAKPVFLLLLPVFFVLHGFTENYDLIPLPDALKLTAIYLGATIVLTALAWVFYRDLIRSALIVFALMAVYFFFGSFHDGLKNLLGSIFLTKYKVILPVLLVFLVIVLVWLKRKKQTPWRTVLYLNTLFIVLLIWQLVSVAIKISTHEKIDARSNNLGFIACNDCNKPDVYLVIADGYAGQTELNDQFSFDNSEFLNELQKRGFHIVPNSRSNYNFTPFVMSSMMNMNYLDNLEGSNTSKHDMSICYNTLKKSQTLYFLQKIGYDFYNYSIFDFDRQPSVTRPTFLPRKTKLLTSQTLIDRLHRDLWFHLVTDLKLKSAMEGLTYYDLNNNNKIYDLTLKTAREKKTAPKFVYTHLVMPHYPYYFDRNGKAVPENLLNTDYWSDKEAYTGYLLYSNKKLLELVDQIKSSSARPPLIILMGDHGFREFKDSVDKKYHFMNLNAVYLPGGDYSKFYDSLTGINQFRVIFNSQFGQRLSLLKDSTSFLRE